MEPWERGGASGARGWPLVGALVVLPLCPFWGGWQWGEHAGIMAMVAMGAMVVVGGSWWCGALCFVCLSGRWLLVCGFSKRFGLAISPPPIQSKNNSIFFGRPYLNLQSTVFCAAGTIGKPLSWRLVFHIVMLLKFRVK